MDGQKLAERMRKHALAYPETYEEAPWGDRVVKVRGKIFFFCGAREGHLALSVKLPRSRHAALALPGTRPTPYGLGKSGWVSAEFPDGKKVPEDLIKEWIDESYRALAPKKLVAQLSTGGEPVPRAAAPGRSAKLPAKAEAKPAAAKTAKTPAKPATKAAANPTAKPITRSKARPIKGRVMLLCHDPLRVERAQRELAARGIAVVDATANPADVRARAARLDAVIVDVGRLQDEGLALAAHLDASDWPILIFIVGIRDAEARKRAQAAATSADLFRAPPGDPAVADAIAETLARYAS